MAAPEAPAIRADSPPSIPEVDEGMILRKLPGYLGKGVSLLAIGTSIYHIYVGVYGAPEPYFFRVLHLTLMLTLGFLLFPKSGKGPINKISLSDWIMIGVWLAATSYIFSNLDYISNRMFFITPLTMTQRFFAIATIITVLEVTRRTVGLALTGVAAVVIVYAFAGPYLPGVFFHTGRKLDFLLDLQYLNPDGVFGLITGIAATFVMMFIIFGAFLNHSGFGAFVIDIATALAGWSRGGPAKVAVVASGLIGMIQGVSTANVVTTGVFTIPMMKRIGFRPAFAGGVEAAASTGGNVMPPVMAAAAFVMSEVTGIPYITIIKHAFVPATLYFLSIGIMVHLYSVQHGIKPTPREETPQLGKVLNERGYLLIPIIVLVWLLFIGKSPMLSAIASIGAVIVMNNLRWYGIPVIALDWLFIGGNLDWILIWGRMDWILTWASRSTLAAIVSAGLVVALSLHRKNIRTMLGQIIRALEEGARNTVIVSTACAASGIIFSVIQLTGFGNRFASQVVSISGGNLPFLLVLAALSSLIIGTGIPMTAAYILQIGIIIPSLLDAGIPVVQAHLFVIFFCSISLITPPMAVTSYAAATIAGADMIKTSFEAIKLAGASYIIPFMFALSPALLLIGTPGEIILAVTTATLGISSLAVSLQGFLTRQLNYGQRTIFFIGSIALIQPGLYTDGLGILLLLVGILSQRVLRPAGEITAGPPA